MENTKVNQAIIIIVGIILIISVYSTIIPSTQEAGNEMSLYNSSYLVSVGDACIQEQSNLTTATDGPCSLNYTGSYNFTGTFAANEEYAADGNYSTSTSCGPGNCYLYVSYVKPNNITALTARVVHTGGTNTVANLTNDCMEQDIVNVLYLKANMGGGPPDGPPQT